MNRAMHGTVTPATCNSPTQANASSIYPATASSGAPCYQNTVNKKNEPTGDALCASMQKGELWSTFGGLEIVPTFGAKNTSFLPPFGEYR